MKMATDHTNTQFRLMNIKFLITAKEASVAGGKKPAKKLIIAMKIMLGMVTPLTKVIFTWFGQLIFVFG